MGIVFDAGVAVSGEGDLPLYSPYVKLLVDTIPVYYSHSGTDPIRWFDLGTIGGQADSRRDVGRRLIYAEQFIDPFDVAIDSVYWILPVGVSGVLYRGVVLPDVPAVASWVYRSTPQTIPNGGYYLIEWETVGSDVFGMWQGGGDPTVMKVPTDGWYVIDVGALWAPNGAGNRLLQLNAGAGGTVDMLQSPPNDTGGQTVLQAGWNGPLVANDEITAYVYQGSGGDLDLAGDAPYSTWISVVRVG